MASGKLYILFKDYEKFTSYSYINFTNCLLEIGISSYFVWYASICCDLLLDFSLDAIMLKLEDKYFINEEMPSLGK